jgi:hypothetical protein
MPDLSPSDPWKTYQELCKQAHALEKQAQTAWAQVDELTEGFCAPAATLQGIVTKLRFVRAVIEKTPGAELPATTGDLHHRVLASAIDDLEEMILNAEGRR